jgi:hypothetical protein
MSLVEIITQLLPPKVGRPRADYTHTCWKRLKRWQEEGVWD